MSLTLRLRTAAQRRYLRTIRCAVLAVMMTAALLFYSSRSEPVFSQEKEKPTDYRQRSQQWLTNTTSIRPLSSLSDDREAVNVEDAATSANDARLHGSQSVQQAKDDSLNPQLLLWQELRGRYRTAATTDSSAPSRQGRLPDRSRSAGNGSATPLRSLGEVRQSPTDDGREAPPGERQPKPEKLSTEAMTLQNQQQLLPPVQEIKSDAGKRLQLPPFESSTSNAVRTRDAAVTLPIEVIESFKQFLLIPRKEFNTGGNHDVPVNAAASSPSVAHASESAAGQQPADVIEAWRLYLGARQNNLKFVSGNDFRFPPPDDFVPQTPQEPPTKCNLSDVHQQLYSFHSSSPADTNTECPAVPPRLVGKIPVFNCAANLAELEALDFHVEIGGHYSPKHCTPRSKMAIILPFRNRREHLVSFLLNMHPFLQKQELEYTIFVINQANDEVFNKGILLNTGAAVASRLGKFDCYVFHDIDLLPENDNNVYRCPLAFQHLSVAIDKFNYKLPYSFLVGGVLAADKTAFEKINGYSDLYFGWGGEDDDLAARIEYHGYHVKRYMQEVARYRMIRHDSDFGNERNPERFYLLEEAGRRSLSEGFRSNVSEVLGITYNKLFTFVNVTFNRDHVTSTIHFAMLAQL